MSQVDQVPDEASTEDSLDAIPDQEEQSAQIAKEPVVLDFPRGESNRDAVAKDKEFITQRLSQTSPVRAFVPRQDRLDLDRLVGRLVDTLDTNITRSNLIRSAVSLILRCEESLLRRASSAKGTLNRPPNDDPLQIAEFDDGVADLLHTAFIDSPPRATAWRRK